MKKCTNEVTLTGQRVNFTTTAEVLQSGTGSVEWRPGVIEAYDESRDRFSVRYADGAREGEDGAVRRATTPDHGGPLMNCH